MKELEVGTLVPTVTFKTRVRDETIKDDNPFKWEDLTTDQIFKDRRVILFALPGAFTPTCSALQLPSFELMHPQFTEAGIDDVYCLSVNDSFVMNQWSKWAGVKNIKVIPDGSGEFTRKMGMLVDKNNLSFGMRSWRYAMLVNDGVVEKCWIEPGKCDNAENDPYGETSPEKILEYVILESPVPAVGRNLQLDLFESIDSKAVMS